MSTNCGVVYVKPGVVEVRDIAAPKFEDPHGHKINHAVILKIVSTNICGSDQHMISATSIPVSSLTSRRHADMTVSPIFTKPPGNACFPTQGSCPRRMSSTRPNGSKTTQSVAKAGVRGKVMLGP